MSVQIKQAIAISFKLPNTVLYVFGSICFSILLLNCNPSTPKELNIKMEVLFQKEKQALCHLTTLKEKITTVWDRIAQLLEEQLPEEMPEDEKSNMIAVRNANLIRMFQSYDSLEADLKDSIQKAEAIDLEIMKTINEQKKILEEVELEKMRLMEKLPEETRTEFTQKLEKK
ncbi:MAG: hypothetical protein R2769_02630 [Saprospiraceae bacterium]